MSQMPEVAGSWPEEGAQYVPGAPMEPVQQAYPPQAPYQQPYQQQQGYPEQQYHQAQQPQQQYPPQSPYQEQTAPQPMVFEEEQASVPSEFDHLFRDSAPQERRSISARQPMVSGPGAAPSPGFPQQAQPQHQQAPQQQATQVAPQQQAATSMFEPAPQQQYQQQPAPGYQNQPQFGGPFGYDNPGGPGDSGSGKRRTPLIIGGAVVLIAAVGLYFGLSGGSGSTKTPAAKSSTTATASANSNETAQQQADAVYALVKEAKSLRDAISNGVVALEACDISTASTEINATAKARAAAAAQVATLPVNKISGGASVISALQTAWQDSATSDEDFAKVASDFASGSCTKSAVRADSNYQAAASASNTAGSAKSTAADAWNQVMANYESKVSESDL